MKYKTLMNQKMDLEDKLEDANEIIKKLKAEIEELKRKFTDKSSKDQLGLNKMM